MEKTLNCKGMACPLPVVTAKKAFEEFTEDGILTVLVDNETAVTNLTKLAGKFGFGVSHGQKAEKEYEVVITVKAGNDAAEPAEQKKTVCAAAGRRGAVVVLSSNQMGNGDEKLGRSLMKAYLFALTNVDPVPETVIAYNTGAYLTTEGSDSLEDLKNLEAAGTRIITCGTCLNFYGLTEKLAVGSVSNMYEIADTMANAALLIRP